jgi:hypothetical protein
MVVVGWATGMLFFSVFLATIGFVIGIGGFLLAALFGTAFACETVGEAANAMTQEQNALWWDHPNTVNQLEVESLIRKAFCEQFSFEPTMLTREAHF